LSFGAAISPKAYEERRRFGRKKRRSSKFRDFKVDKWYGRPSGSS